MGVVPSFDGTEYDAMLTRGQYGNGNVRLSRPREVRRTVPEGKLYAKAHNDSIRGIREENENDAVEAA